MDSSIEEILQYGNSYLDTRIDGIKVSAKESFVKMSLWACTFFCWSMMLLMAVLFLMYGMTMGLGEVLGGNLWLSYMITGGCFILCLMIFTKISFYKMRKKSVEKKIKLYMHERESWHKKFGHNIPGLSMGPFQNESDFLAWKADMVKSAVIKTAHHLKQEVAEAVGIKKWTQEYPFYSTGMAAAAGFIIGGEMTAVKPVCDTSPPDSSGAPSLGQSFVSLLFTVTEDVLKEAVKPMVAQHFAPKEKSAG